MNMPIWKRVAEDLVITPSQLQPLEDMEPLELDDVVSKYPMRASSYYLSLIEEKDDPIWKQVIPSRRELDDSGFKDPLGEDRHSPVRSIVHRYPDRVLFTVTHECAVYCRFCTRKNKLGIIDPVTPEDLEAGIHYIQEHDVVRDVILSGGDPLTLPDTRLEYILSRLRAIPHLEIIRIGTRVPVCLPMRITHELCRILKNYHPLYMNLHFNHPREITEDSSRACAMLADAGIPLGNQSVLLKGVNDDAETMKELVQGLLRIRVKPYYVYLMDLVQGADHFRTPVQAGLHIISSLRGHTTGMAVPHLVVDAPGGGGKIALVPDPVLSRDDEWIKLVNFQGNHYSYPVE